jgi:Undecaprenyl-phosphate glucose phosphotransferase
MSNVLLRDIKLQTPPSSVTRDGSPRRIEVLLAKAVAAEYLAVATTCLLTSIIYFKLAKIEWPPGFEYIAAIFLIPPLVVLSAIGFRQYSAIQTHSRDRFMLSGVGAVALAFALFLSLLFVVKVADWYSRGTFFSQLIGVSVVVLIMRRSTYAYIRRSIHSGIVEARKAVLVGDVNLNVEIVKELHQFGIRCAGVLDLPYTHTNLLPGKAEFARNAKEFVERCRELEPDDVIFLAAATDFSLVSMLVDFLSELPVSVHVVPIGVRGLWGAAKISNFGRTVAIQVLNPPLSRFDLILKRAFDICVSVASIILLTPFLLMVSLAIKLDSRGPVLFKQKRQGYNNRIIHVLKFRSMTIVEDGETSETFTQAKSNDARITRLGHMLRRSNIDELPQLFNVLRGEMSIVGPRPHPIALNKIFETRIAPFSRRHKVKPGLTGWAQVNGFRGETDTVAKMQRRIEYDLYYIDNWTFFLDLKIIVMTLFSKNAYLNAV